MVLNEDMIYVLTTQNTYNIKLIVLGIIFLYSILAIIFKDRINEEKSYFHYWLKYLSFTVSSIYLVFSPMFALFLLNLNISMEIFVLIIVAFYLLFTAVFIGLSIYQGSSSVFKVFGFDDWNEFKDKRKEKLSMKKYG